MATITGTRRADKIVGSKFDDIIDGLGDNDIIDGGDGNDTISGGAGLDTLTGGTGDDIIDGGSENDSLDGGDGKDALYGGSGVDTLVGGLGNDTLDGGSGADTMTGGAGDDTYYVDNIGDVVVEAKNEGDDTVHATVSYTLTSSVEDLVLDNAGGAINGTGNGLDNFIEGNSSNNTLSGAGGNDQLKGGGGSDIVLGGAGNDALYAGGADLSVDFLVGGTGDDRYVVSEADDFVLESSNEGIDLVTAGIDYTLGDNVEILDLSLGVAVSGTGNALDNIIAGNESDNVLDGGGGNDVLVSITTPRWGSDVDTLLGGDGDDKFVVVALDDAVVESANEGTDEVWTNTSYTLPANVEILHLLGTDQWLDWPTLGWSTLGGWPILGSEFDDLDGTGNRLDNSIYGTRGINVLSGAAGDDDLFGRAGADVLVGGADDDHLDGGTEADVMIGGTGNDGYIVDDAGDVVMENANEGSDFVDSWIAYTLGANVENLDLHGDTAIDGTGNDLDNFIGGNAGSNVLTGGGGNDTFDAEDGNDTVYGGDGNDSLDGGPGTNALIGGAGDDFYFLGRLSVGDTIVENAGEGTDSVLACVTHTLAANVENLTLREGVGAIGGTGNSLDNVITGNADNNVLSGMAGADTLVGANGSDQLFGGAGNDSLDGGISDDILDGGISNDTLVGGAGIDLLTGGAGVDKFQFNFAAEGADVIADFVSGTDRVWIDNTGFGIAGTGSLAANGVAFVSGPAATGAGPTLMFDAATHQVLWDADGSGAGSAQLLATLLGVNAMSAGDFLIV